MIMVWESAYDLVEYCNMVPEVVGSQKDVISDGILPTQRETIPEPKCKEVGYTALEWLRHWSKRLTDTVLHAPAEEQRQEYLRLIKNKI